MKSIDKRNKDITAGLKPESLDGFSGLNLDVMDATMAEVAPN
ncbi:MAG: hypothetical protein QNK37_10025 [Acidobacteriota bacterium]|nr:hypothetical protein [Acidobacteriota bacterium]